MPVQPHHVPDEQFVSEEMVPVPGTADSRPMARGEPGLCGQFIWRRRRYAVRAVLESWKTSRREGGRADGALYLRRHWYRIATDVGTVMTVYCERQASRRKRPKSRWYVYTVQGAGE